RVVRPASRLLHLPDIHEAVCAKVVQVAPNCSHTDIQRHREFFDPHLAALDDKLKHSLTRPMHRSILGPPARSTQPFSTRLLLKLQLTGIGPAYPADSRLGSSAAASSDSLASIATDRAKTAPTSRIDALMNIQSRNASAVPKPA